MNNIRRPSIEAAGNGGGTSSTAAQRSTSTPRRRGAAKQATTCREEQDLLRSFQQPGQSIGQLIHGSKGKLAKLNYMDIKLLLDRQILKNKRGSLSEKVIQTLVKDWHNRRSEGDLRQETIEMEIKAMEKKLRRYNVEQLGEMPSDQENGTMQILVCQIGGCASKKARELKIAATEKLIRKYDISLCLFMELNFNWTKVSPSANLASWFNKEEREMRYFTAHNTQEFDETFGRDQPGAQGWCADMSSYNTRGSHPQTLGGLVGGALGHSSAILLTSQE